MEDAPDKSVQRRSKKNEPPETVQATAQREIAKQVLDRAKKNPVVETYYTMKADKLILVKKKANGSKYMTPIGSIKVGAGASDEEKKNAKALIEKVKQLQASKELRIEY